SLKVLINTAVDIICDNIISEVSLSQLTEKRDKQSFLSIEEMIYPDLVLFIQKLRKRYEKRHYTLSKKDAETDSEKTATLYDIVN
ncbi:MAG: hypothetical protein LQ347_005569, partial [Umbilicaria vellea]